MAIKCSKCHTENPDDSRFCNKCATPLPLSDKVTVSQTVTITSEKDEPIVGKTFANRYLIIEELGRGGMGRVYKALDKEINEHIALKVLKPEISADHQIIERFRNELKFSRRISHENVCKMFDLSKAGKTYFISMEHIQGEDLKSILTRVGPLSPGKAIIITKQICEGLIAAHQIGIVHRDLKPHNIMIDKEGNARIMDFGIARSIDATGMTTTGIIIGTPEYMSPEQVASEDVDPRSDVYSLGVILYEVLTGIVPFKGDSALSIALKHKTEAPKNPRHFNAQIPKELSSLIIKCLEKDREKRYRDVKELHSELTAIEKEIPTVEKVLVKTSAKLRKKRLRTSHVLGIIFAIVLITGGGYFVYDNFLKGKNGEIEEKLPVIPKVPAQKPKEVVAQNGILEINSVPEGADVYLDNKRAGVTPFKSEFPPGDYKILVKKEPEYKGIEDTLKVNVGETNTKKYTLTPVYLLILNSTPEGARVRVDGNYIGNTPTQIELPRNRCRVEIEKDNQWKKISERLKLKPGRNIIQRSLERIKYSLSIKTNPSRARVFINGNLIGNSPVKKLDSLGEFSIKVEKDGYITVTDSIVVNSDVEKKYDLVKIQPEDVKIKPEKKEDVAVKKPPVKKEIEKKPEEPAVKKESPKKQVTRIPRPTRPDRISLEYTDIWFFPDLNPYPSYIATDQFGHVYVADKKNRAIYKLSSDGMVLEKWIAEAESEGEPIIPHGIAVDTAGNIYISDRGNHRIMKLGKDGSVLKIWGSYGKGRGQLNSPKGIAVDSSNFIFVCDSDNHRIVKFNPDGEVVGNWGSFGKNKRELNSPEGIAIDNDEFVFVADKGNRRIKKFTPDGVFVKEFGDKLKKPVGVAVDNFGFIYVTDIENHKIFIFSPDGSFKTERGSKGNGKAQFSLPLGIAVDSSGYAYVADSGNFRIQRLKIK